MSAFVAKGPVRLDDSLYLHHEDRLHLLLQEQKQENAQLALKVVQLELQLLDERGRRIVAETERLKLEKQLSLSQAKSKVEEVQRRSSVISEIISEAYNIDLKKTTFDDETGLLRQAD